MFTISTIEIMAIARTISVLLVLGVAVALAACTPTATEVDESDDAAAIIHVPADQSTIQGAVDAASPGDLVLVAAGTYTESITVATDDVTLRGEDRNAVIIDGEGLRPQGVLVIADGVRVENLTVTAHTFNGVLVTGMHDDETASAHGVDGYTRLDPEEFPPIQRFAIDGVTAYNNGLYGIYAFDAQNGSITNSYASGSADSGFYVGQCQECNIVVSGNVAERNAIGFENANASDSLVIVGNRFSDNRVGMTLISNYQEAFVPQRGNTVVGNVIADNASGDSPAHAEGAFGIGLGISGGTDNDILRNLIQGNPSAGVQLSGTEDLASTGNTLGENALIGNGVDVADVSTARAPSANNCFTDNSAFTSTPSVIPATGCTQPTVGADTAVLPTLSVPPGISFLKVAAPLPQPNMTGAVDEIPERLKNAPQVPDAAAITVPEADLLADRTGSQS